MASTKKGNKFRDVFVKLTGIFPKDLYIVNGVFGIAGPESKDENRGLYIVTFSPDTQKLLKTAFGEKVFTVYIPSIKLFKDDATKYTILDPDSIQYRSCNATCTEFLKEDIFRSMDWETFQLSDETLRKLFVDKEMVELFGDADADRPPIICGRNLFPLMSEKTLNTANFKYVDEDGSGLKQFIIRFTHTYFDIWLKYLVLPIHDNNPQN